ncbi:nucleotidyltransferase family protein [Mucilaginibacter sp.]|uniref:nucleotidyltransferase family protein n=1 Tax=Mucilaginibacter sp. TaxID=1882438 RepID=UPI003B00197E
MINLNSAQNTATIILAAGSSSRLGKPKQLLHYQHESLIKRVVKTALQIASENIFVVTGFLHQELVEELSGFPVNFVHNPNWAAGMGTSIKTGIKAVQQSKNADRFDAVLFLLSDQPLITAEHLNRLTDQFYADKNSMISATTYAGTQGVPAVFDRSLFPVLEQLSGKGGAGFLFKKYRENLISVPFENAAVDIDTEQDYLDLIKPEKDSPK